MKQNQSLQADTGALVAEYFPMSPRQRAEASGRRVPEVSLPPLSRPDEGTLRPGEAYRIYHARDILGCVPDDYRFIVGRAARWTGVQDDYMCFVIERFERRFLRWWKTQQRRERDPTLDPELMVSEVDLDSQSTNIH
jgi:RNA polymerase I-specific transcription initiation factor RRN7